MRFIRDRGFWLAIAAGVCVWVLMWGVFAMPVTLGRNMTVWQFALLIIAYPVLEEIVFRGALQGWLLEYRQFQVAWLGLSLANLLTSVLFTGLHFINHTPLWAALVFAPSLVFGWARDRFGIILPSIALHVFYNAGFLFLFG